MPAHAYLYGLPYDYYQRLGVCRFGFHGLSHAYVALAAARFLKRRAHSLRIISCHLGNGASVCASDHGRSVVTTMGFTPTEGLLMGTRCGDLDPGVVTYLQRAENLSAEGIEAILNKRSGLLGISGVSSDMREVLAAADEGNARALVALKAYCYRIRKTIGAYIAAMGGADAVVFTGGVGQGSAMVRALSLQGLHCMGIHPPVRESGDLDDTPGCTLEGPAGSLVIDRGVICALRHIHMTPADALRYGVKDKSFLRVRIDGDRELVFGDVLVRVSPTYALAMHIDTDEANAAGVATGTHGHIEGIQS